MRMVLSECEEPWFCLNKMFNNNTTIIIIMNYNQLNKLYLSLCKQAEQTMNRKECLEIIHQADSIRMKMNQREHNQHYPIVYGG